MVIAHGSRTRRRLAAVLAGVFAAGFATMLAAQLALMSLLDTRVAADAARDVADSAFVVGLVDDAVRSAVTPVAGPEVAAQVAAVASSDPRVRDVVATALVGAHRQVVDPSAPRGPEGAAVNATIADVLDEAGARAGVDLSGIGPQVQVPEARPAQVPDIGLRSLASWMRVFGAIVAVVAGAAAVAVHPRPAIGLAGLGARAAFVCVGWAVVLLVVGWLIGRVAETLFGELLDAVWSLAAPAMLGVVGAGALLGAGVWLAGRSADGFLRARG